MSVYVFNSLLNGEYLNLFTVEAFCSKSISVKRTLPVENLYLLAFLDDKVEILAICLSKSY